MSLQFHAEVDRSLRAAGWRPGRHVPDLVRQWRVQLESGSRFILHPAAERVLLEFGGLHIGAAGPGVDRSPSELNLDPTVAAGEDDRFLDYFPELHGRAVFPLGEVDGGNGFLGIDTTGRTYLLMDEVCGRWPTFISAIEGLLRGIRDSFPQKPSTGAV